MEHHPRKIQGREAPAQGSRMLFTLLLSINPKPPGTWNCYNRGSHSLPLSKYFTSSGDKDQSERSQKTPRTVGLSLCAIGWVLPCPWHPTLQLGHITRSSEDQAGPQAALCPVRMPDSEGPYWPSTSPQSQSFDLCLED